MEKIQKHQGPQKGGLVNKPKPIYSIKPFTAILNDASSVQKRQNLGNGHSQHLSLSKLINGSEKISHALSTGQVA